MKGTVLDLDVEEFGAMIRLPCPCMDWQNREITEVSLPPLAAIREPEVVVLHPIQGSAQSLLVSIESFKSKDIEQAQMTQAVSLYQKTAIRELFGRNGRIAKNVMSSRMKASARAVLLPRAGGDPFTCEIPDWMMTSLKLKPGDYVVVGRDPTLWEGGIEVLKVIGCPSNVIRLHPLLYAQLNADNDGDTVWVLAIPRYLHPEARTHLGSFMKRTAVWPKPYNETGDKVNWDTVDYEMTYRAAPTGFSVGPEDILNDTGALERVEKITGKQLKEDCVATALGLSEKDWQAITLKTNNDQLIMKVCMGPIGAAAMAVRILAGEKPRTRRSASLISERLEQKLLDSKKAKAADDKFSYMTALDILQIRNEWTKASSKEATEALAEGLGLKKSDVRPIVETIWEKGQGLAAIMRDEHPLFASTTQIAENHGQAVVLAEELFVHKKAEAEGFGRLIINTLAVKKEVADAVEA